MIVGLLGGNELGDATRDFDAALAAAAGAREVCVVAAAAFPPGGYAKSVRHATRYFAGLGLATRDAGLRRRSDAARPAVVEALRASRLTYLLGGDPGHLLDSLLGTPAWSAIRLALRDGGAVAGSSAGAMVLAAAVLLRSRDPRPAQRHARPALGLVRDAVVIPHLERFERGWRAAARAATPGLDVLGLDEMTGIVHDGSPGWRVHGPGEVKLWRRGADAPLTRRAPQALRWRAPAFQRPPEVV